MILLKIIARLEHIDKRNSLLIVFLKHLFVLLSLSHSLSLSLSISPCVFFIECFKYYLYGKRFFSGDKINITANYRIMNLNNLYSLSIDFT